MKRINAKQITIAAMTMAIVCIGTMVIQIPIPLGYMNLGNGCILLIGLYFGRKTGFLAGGIGSAMADLLSGYTQWVIPTLVVKGLMGYVAGTIAGKDSGKLVSVRTFMAAVAGTIVMISGYTLFGCFMYGSVAAGLAQVPGLTTEGIIGMILFYVLGAAFEAAKLPGLFRKNA